jgi:hypothetical protein
MRCPRTKRRFRRAVDLLEALRALQQDLVDLGDFVTAVAVESGVGIVGGGEQLATITDVHPRPRPSLISMSTPERQLGAYQRVNGLPKTSFTG